MSRRGLASPPGPAILALDADRRAGQTELQQLQSQRNEKSGQKLVFLDDWEKADERLKGATAIVRRLADIAKPKKAA